MTPVVESLAVRRLVLPGVLALALAAIHLYADRIAVFRRVPRSRWLSIAGGASVAYVFVHLLPEVADAAAMVDERTELPAVLDAHVYLLALLGFATFYGIEQFVRWANRTPGDAPADRLRSVFWLHLASFAVYNGIIGYLLVHYEPPAAATVLAFAVAMGLHLLVTDVGLSIHHGRPYHRRGRWVLAVAILVGCAFGYLTAVDDLLIAILSAFLAGGVVLNVIKEELPADRESRFWAFAAGATGYAVVLILA